VAWLIKFALIYRRRRLGYQRVIIDVPYHLVRKTDKRQQIQPQEEEELEDRQVDVS